MVEAFVPSSVGSWHLGHEQTNILKEIDTSKTVNFECFFKTQYTLHMWILLTALYQFCGISSWRMTLPSFGPRYWVVTCTESVFSGHTYTNIHARFFVYKKHTQSLSLFFLITVTSSPLAMGFTARTIIVPSLVCKNQDVRKGLQNVIIINTNTK